MFINVNDKLRNGDKIVIYGAGVDGISAYCTLLNREIEVACFCDRDPLKQEVYIMNKPVISPGELFDKYKDAKIVIGSPKNSVEICEYLQENGIKRIYQVEGKLDERIRIGRISVSRENWYALIGISKKKKIVIYGNGSLEKELFRKLHIGGMPCEGMIDNLSLIDLEDFSDKMIIVPEEDEEIFSEFDKKGLVRKIHYRSLWDLREINLYLDVKNQVPDINLGISYRLSEKYAGYAVLGDDDAKYRIMVLGSSTSHEGYFTYKSWAYFLYEHFCREGMSVQIINGGIRAYNVQMMTEKLLRDLPDIQPDMVVCYSGGANNGMYGYTKAEAPFNNAYVREVYKKAYKGNNSDFVEICEGIRGAIPVEKKAETLAKDYLYACDVMKAICDIKGVSFVNFLYCHAGMCDVNSLPKEDREACYHYRQFMKDEQGRKIANRFYKEVKKQLREWQYDHTELFVNTPGVYIDAIHVNEEGNKLIGQDVYRIIRPMMKYDE